MKAVVAVLFAVMVAAAPSAPQSETPRAFIERIYAGYTDNGYNSLDHLDEVFDAPLAAEIRKDTGTADEVGYLNGDPICDCQEVAGLEPRIERVQLRDDRAAEARIMLNFRPGHSRMVTLKLVLNDDGWRVADVATPREPSLLEALEQSNRAALSNGEAKP